MADSKEENPKDPETTSVPTRKSKNLKEATQHLKEEALRRYQLKHKDSLDGQEQAVEEGTADGEETELRTDSEAEQQAVRAETDARISEAGVNEDEGTPDREEADSSEATTAAAAAGAVDGAEEQISSDPSRKDLSPSTDPNSAERVPVREEASERNPMNGGQNEKVTGGGSEEAPGTDSHDTHGNTDDAGQASNPEASAANVESSPTKPEDQTANPEDPTDASVSQAKDGMSTNPESQAPSGEGQTSTPAAQTGADGQGQGQEQDAVAGGSDSSQAQPEATMEGGEENAEPVSGIAQGEAPEQEGATEDSKPEQEASNTAGGADAQAPAAAAMADEGSATNEASAASGSNPTGEGGDASVSAEAGQEPSTEGAGSGASPDGADSNQIKDPEAPATKGEGEETEQDKDKSAGEAASETPGAPAEKDQESVPGGAEVAAEKSGETAGDQTATASDNTTTKESTVENSEAEAAKGAAGDEVKGPSTEEQAGEEPGKATEGEAADASKTGAAGATVDGDGKSGEEAAPAAEGAQSAAVDGAAEQQAPAGGADAPAGETGTEQTDGKPEGGATGSEQAEVAPEKKTDEAVEGATGNKPEGAAQVEAKGATQENSAEEEESADGQDPNTKGDEQEIHSESPIDDDAPKIPEDFFYNLDEHISRARVMEDSGLPQDILTLHHSFGYDCHKRANLQMLDENTALFSAGNVVELLNLRTREQIYLRSTSGGGIGALAVHPSHKYFAVAEKGVAPNINIYEYPSLRLYRILRGGTQATYAYVDYSPDGKLLASVGGDPDYMLTLWDWRNEMIVLRSKAFSQDIFRVTFSSELHGQLTSSGTGHIRFWKMAKTFTGLKLQGYLGKFGKTEISDIEGYVELPDGKVLSGCEWGNMLVWDGGLIKVEISRKGRKPCHNGLIQQIIMDEGELMTIGTDGYIRVWDFETVDTADTTDESSVFEMEPMNELKVGDGVQLKSIVKSVNAEEPTMWYAQDANGGIWKLDLSFSFTSMAPEKLVSYHSGVITGCDTSPVSHLVATTGIDKTVRVYDYVAKEVLCEAHFNQAGCSLLWVPKTVDTRGATILIGFEDGVVRAMTLQTLDAVDIHGRKKENVSELVLKQAFKPHTKNVTSMAMDSKGELFATGSDDKTIFFFDVSKSFEPIGFIRTPSAVTYMSWSPSSHSKNTLLVCCKGGQVIEYASPEDGNFDTSKTFEIQGLTTRTHQFKSIKSRLRHEEDVARRSKELEEKRQKEEEERRIRIERGLETESDLGDEEAPAEEEEEEEWSPYIPSEPSPILYGLHAKEEGKVWLSAGEFDTGYLYEVNFLSEAEKQKMSADMLYEPLRNLPMLEANDRAVTVLRYSGDGKQMIMGLDDGSVRIHPLNSGDVGEMGPYWILNVHDNDYGRVTHIASSFDNRYLFSVGADGNFFTFNIMDQDKVDQKVVESKAKIPSAKKPDSEKRIDDIDDPNAYSIEDAKQKAEHDKMIRLAEEKKMSVKRSIEVLRLSFRKLLEKNTELPSHLMLDRKEFEMDPEIKRELEYQKQEKIDLVRKEMAWEEEKFKIALDKLRTRFKDIVECERIVVKAFQTKHEVCSFRSTKLPDDFYTAKAEMERRKTTLLSTKDGELGSRQATQDLLKGQTATSDGQGEGSGAGPETHEGAKIMTSLKGSMGERINKALAKVEEKKRKRALRRSQWEELLSGKPDDNYEDPADVAAIKEAQENMGDYKLKSADDYVVPDHLRMNTDKARSKLLILKDLIHQRKYDFNQRLLALRDKKIGIIEEIKDIVKRLGEVQNTLPPESVKELPDIPEMHPDELPEKKFEYTRETLIRFKKNMAKRKPGGGGQEDSGGFGGFGAAGGQTQSEASTPVASATRRTPTAAAGEEESKSTFMEAEVKETSLQAKIRRAEEIRCYYTRDQLLKRVDEVVKNFDAELRVLRHEKFKLDIDLKNADLRQVTLFEELLLLKDFEKRENVLADKVEGKQQERQDMQAKVIEVQNNITLKKKDIEKLQEKDKMLNAQFQASLGENNKFADYLMKVFKKKIKRSKKKANEGEGSDEESDDESDEDSDWSESEEESESEEGGYDLDACPQGCDQNLYDNTCTLREKRLDIEEALAEEKKNRDTLIKELDALNKKTRIIDNALRQAENELEAFQLEKQRKLNELDVVVSLKLHQIQYMINGVLPQDLSPCLVFEATGVTRLVHRIKELEHEKTSQKKQQKEARKKHIQLNKDRKVFEARISEMEDVCNKMMLQKFGRIVDLEKLETVTVNRGIEELKEKLRNNEVACSSELLKWEERIKEAREYITQLVRENTQRLDQLNMLLCERRDFEGSLDSRQKNLGGEFTGVRKSDVHERQRLIQLVHLQAQEVEALKEEITLLSRKGGHILPPAQPPMPQSANTVSGPGQPVMPNA